jgi:hypothetical protein
MSHGSKKHCDIGFAFAWMMHGAWYATWKQKHVVTLSWLCSDDAWCEWYATWKQEWEKNLPSVATRGLNVFL